MTAEKKQKSQKTYVIYRIMRSKINAAIRNIRLHLSVMPTTMTFLLSEEAFPSCMTAVSISG